MKLRLLLLFQLVPAALWAQEWSFGPKVSLGLNGQTPYRETTIDGNRIGSDMPGEAPGSSFGLFIRYDRPRWYTQAEVNRGRYRLDGFRVDGTGNDAWASTSSTLQHDVRLLGGYKPLPWLRLHAGVGAIRGRYEPDAYFTDRLNSVQQRLSTVQSPAERRELESQLSALTVNEAVRKSYRNLHLEGQAGLGVDIGGLTLDLTYHRTLTPTIDGVTYGGQTYPLQQHYSYYALHLGYRILPVRKYLLAPRKNRAYERMKQDIPFYRNEFHVSGGLLGEDIGSAFIYENRYTRYLKRRLGLTVGLNLMQLFEDSETGFIPKATTTFRVVTGLRVLPLYTRRSTVGLTTGPMLTLERGLRPTSRRGTQTIDGIEYTVTALGSGSRVMETSLGWQTSLDYHFAATDRLLVGPWLRFIGRDFVPDYVTGGVQIGYRF